LAAPSRFLFVLLSCAGVLSAGTVRSVEIEGTQRSFELETRSCEPLDSETLSRDVRKLWETGWFHDVRVESTGPSEDGLEVVFRVQEKPVQYLRGVQVIGDGKAKPAIAPGTKIDDLQAHRTGAAVARDLIREGYRESAVRTEIVPVGPRQADLVVSVEAGPKYVIDGVEFTGDLKLDVSELKDALAATRSRTLIPGIWRLRPPSSDEGIQTDINRLKALYASQGYFKADVSLGGVQYSGTRATVTYHIDAGTQFGVREIRIAGVDAQPPVPAGGVFPARSLCECLLDARRGAEREGRMDFDVAVQALETERPADSPFTQWVDMNLNVETGPAFTLGRILFRGHHSYGDSTLRRAMKLDEGDLFDWNKVHKSLERINGLGLFQPLTPGDIQISRNPERAVADLTIRVKQMPQGRWGLSGPVGPLSLAGPLHGSIVSRLPGWGRGILEMSTYYAVVSVTGFSSPIFRMLSMAPRRDFIPYFSLERPYMAGQEWASGFAITPQLGWKSMVANYGLTQVHRRLRGTVRGDLPLAAPIVAPIEFQQSASALFCEPPRPRLRWLRAAGGFAFDWFLGQRMF
jgi:outer membrane protein insertion porin family